jgi:hypothetical protein
MTSITLPLKKIPGQNSTLPTFFGGRRITAPAVLILTSPFTLYFYLWLSQGTPSSINLIGFLPYLWGAISIAVFIHKSDLAIETMIEADLDEADTILTESKKYFRRIMISSIVFSIILYAMLSYIFIIHGGRSLLIIGLISISSTGIALSSIMSRHDGKNTLAYILLACMFDTALLIAIHRGLFELALIFPALSIFLMYAILREIEKYDIRIFFERVIN